MAEFGDPIPGGNQSGSESLSEVTIPGVLEAAAGEEIELTEPKPQSQGSEDAVGI